ncbi:MAG: serpin family protein, partial [Chthoniobacterales bacterium]
GYKRSEGLTVVAIPYVGGDLQFLILLPDAPDGLPALEKKLTGDSLSACALLPATSVQLHLPKFKIEPPVMNLGVTLQELGMPSAFNMPRGSANFDGIAEPGPGQELYISDVLHRAFISVDEQGTEAAAATVVAMPGFGVPVRKEPVQVWVNRPFLFAVQHRPSGACLFLGRITDPR